VLEKLKTAAISGALFAAGRPHLFARGERKIRAARISGTEQTNGRPLISDSRISRSGDPPPPFLTRPLQHTARRPSRRNKTRRAYKTAPISLATAAAYEWNEIETPAPTGSNINFIVAFTTSLPFSQALIFLHSLSLLLRFFPSSTTSAASMT
jgi:hypothetical protein